MDNRKCPVCNNEETVLVLEKDGYKIVECDGCGHIYVKNPQEDTSSPFEGKADITKYKPRHKQIMNFLDNYYNSNKKVKVAEIGSGVGHFANLISKYDKYDYVGYELSQGRYDFAKSHGLNVINDYFMESKNTYDAIVMDNVLEHVENPSLIYELVSNSLKSGGGVTAIKLRNLVKVTHR